MSAVISVKLYDAEQILAKLKEIKNINAFEGKDNLQVLLNLAIANLSCEVKKAKSVRFTFLVAVDILMPYELFDNLATIASQYEVIYNESK